VNSGLNTRFTCILLGLFPTQGIHPDTFKNTHTHTHSISTAEKYHPNYHPIALHNDITQNIKQKSKIKFKKNHTSGAIQRYVPVSAVITPD